MASRKDTTRTHLIIPDTQVEPGRPIDHLTWIGNYCADRYGGKQLTRIHLGDHWNMGSLSSYDRKGGTHMEGRRVNDDIAAGNYGFELLDGPATKVQRRQWDDHFLFGNHEYRMQRAIDQDAALDGLYSMDLFDTGSWTRHGFREPVDIDGVLYAHYFYNPNTGRPYAGANLETRLKTIGCSFTMGHQQGLKWGRIESVAGPKIGLVAGSCYLHEEDYLGPQGNDHWRGIIVCNNVENGDYDLMQVSLDYLCRRYEGVPLADYNPKEFA
jgi:hypothetical protein